MRPISRLFLCSALLSCVCLTGCQLAHEEMPRAAEDMPVWGNYKCTSQAPSGEHYIGWSVFEEEAQANAISICHDQTGSAQCELRGCSNDEPQPQEAEDEDPL